jgi:hypothetical protein
MDPAWSHPSDTYIEGEESGKCDARCYFGFYLTPRYGGYDYHWDDVYIIKYIYICMYVDLHMFSCWDGYLLGPHVPAEEVAAGMFAGPGLQSCTKMEVSGVHEGIPWVFNQWYYGRRLWVILLYSIIYIQVMLSRVYLMFIFEVWFCW